jgi:hypothetical protein
LIDKNLVYCCIYCCEPLMNSNDDCWVDDTDGDACEANSDNGIHVPEDGTGRKLELHRFEFEFLIDSEHNTLPDDFEQWIHKILFLNDGGARVISHKKSLIGVNTLNYRINQKVF